MEIELNSHKKALNWKEALSDSLIFISITNNSDSNLYSYRSPIGYEDLFPSETEIYFITEFRKSKLQPFKKYNKRSMHICPVESPEKFMGDTIPPKQTIKYFIHPFKCNGWQEKGWYRITVFVAVASKENELIILPAKGVEIKIK